MHRKDEHQDQQRDHHVFRHAFQTLLQPEREDRKAQHDRDRHIADHGGGVRHHAAERGADLPGVQPDKIPREAVHEVVEDPAGDGRVEHHQQHAADERGVAVDVPFCALRLKLLIHPNGAYLRSAPDGKFDGHDRQTQNDEEDQIQQHKRAAAVLPRHPRKLPHVAHADGAAGRKQDEAEAAAQTFSFHIVTPFLFPTGYCLFYY